MTPPSLLLETISLLYNDNFAVNDDHDDFGDDYDHDHDNHDDLDDHGDLGNDDHFHTSKKLD